MSDATIGPFARYTGLSRKALRLYEEAGLLVPSGIDESTGYRRYDRCQVARARRLAALRDLGVGIAGMREIVDASEPRAALEAWWDAQEASHRERRVRAERTRRLFDASPKPIRVVQLPARQTLTIEIHGHPSGLGEEIGRHLQQLRSLAAGIEGLAGVPAVTWLARDDDETVHVELLRPVARPPLALPDGVSLRTDGPLELATVALRSEELDETDALIALDAIDAWLDEHDADGGLPRQLWIADARHAAPQDVVCLLGVPIT